MSGSPPVLSISLSDHNFSALAPSFACTLAHSRPLCRSMFFSKRAFNVVNSSSCCFFERATFDIVFYFKEIDDRWPTQPLPHGPQLRSWKKAVMSCATAAGSSAGAKWPPRGKTVQRWMLYTRCKYERGGSPSGTVWCANTPNAVGVLTSVGLTECQRLSQ